MMVSLTRWVLRHRVMVVLSWLVLTLGGVIAAGSLSGALSQKFSIPGAAVRTNERIGHEFGSGGSPLVPVVRVARGDLRRPALARQVNRAFRAVAAASPGSRMASYSTTGDIAFLSPDHRTEYALVFTAPGAGGQQLSSAVLQAAQRAATPRPIAWPRRARPEPGWSRSSARVSAPARCRRSTCSLRLAPRPQPPGGWVRWPGFVPPSPPMARGGGGAARRLLRCYPSPIQTTRPAHRRSGESKRPRGRRYKTVALKPAMPISCPRCTARSRR